MMRMFLNTAADMTDILFSGWNTNSWKDVLIAAVIICTITIIFEGFKTLKFYVIVRRKQNPLTNHEQEEYDGHGLGAEVISSQADLLSSIRIPVSTEHVQRRILLFSVESLLHMFNFLYGYILMLLVMTYSVWFLLAIVVGSGVGFFISRSFAQHLTLKYSSFKIQNASSCHGEISRLHQPQRNYHSFTGNGD